MKRQNSKQQTGKKSQPTNSPVFTTGYSPNALAAAYSQWMAHFYSVPTKQAQLIQESIKSVMLLSSSADKGTTEQDAITPIQKPLFQNKRSNDVAREKTPYELMYQAFLTNQNWWNNTAGSMLGTAPQDKNLVELATIKMLDLFSSPNYAKINSQESTQSQEYGNLNAKSRQKNVTPDRRKNGSDKKQDGKAIFAEGEVIYSNRLIDLIQYQAVTRNVHPEPIFIVPAWIMKYYVIDLSAQNALVEYLTEQGFTVFMVLWKSPDINEFDVNMKDYRQLGVMSAIDAITDITGKAKIHGVGYCLGGTLLSIAAATMARNHDERFKTLSLFVAQVDFTEAGPLQLRRADDLDLSFAANDNLVGKRNFANDLMGWDYDANLMPYKLHNKYLHQLFLNNDLAEGRYLVDELPISIADIQAPVFVVGTENDLVAPWRSVYKINALSDTDMTFLLIGGGHNANLVHENGNSYRSYRMATSEKGAKDLNPESWIETHKSRQGSWWPELSKWLKIHSGNLISAPQIRSPQKRRKTIDNSMIG